MPSAAPTTRSHEAKPKERRPEKPAPVSASSVLSVPAMGLLPVGQKMGKWGWGPGEMARTAGIGIMNEDNRVGPE